MQTVMASELLDKNFVGADELRRELTTILRKLKNNRGEFVVTTHGKPQAVLLDINSYLDYQELQERIADLDPKLIKEINEGIAEIEAGKGIPAEEVFKKLGL